MRILDCQSWERIKDITNNVEEIKRNFDAVQIPPIQPHKAINEQYRDNEWWKNFQVNGFSIGNEHGDIEDIKKLCSTGITVIANIVLTHMSGDERDHLTPNKEVDDILKQNPYFWREKKNIDYNNRYSVINHCNGCPSLRMDNWDLQDIIIKFMNSLIDAGVRGFRIDSGKMISTPEEDGNTFWPRVLDNLHHKEELFIYAEVIFPSKQLIEKYSKYVKVLKELSHTSYEVDKESTVNFIESHDSYLDKTIGFTARLTDDQVIENYRYLVRDFPHTVFYNRPNSDMWRRV